MSRDWIIQFAFRCYCLLKDEGRSPMMASALPTTGVCTPHPQEQHNEPERHPNFNDPFRLRGAAAAERVAIHANIHVHGYQERGNINTPFELAILNEVDRFHLAMDAIARVPLLRNTGAHAMEWLRDQIIEHLTYAHAEGIDQKEIREWTWAP